MTGAASQCTSKSLRGRPFVRGVMPPCGRPFPPGRSPNPGGQPRWLRDLIGELVRRGRLPRFRSERTRWVLRELKALARVGDGWALGTLENLNARVRRRDEWAIYVAYRAKGPPRGRPFPSGDVPWGAEPPFPKGRTPYRFGRHAIYLDGSTPAERRRRAKRTP